MATKTDEASILGSGDPAYQDEARAEAIERAGGEDAYDEELHWTAQQGPAPASERNKANEPTQFLPGQLPDPEGAQSALVPELKVPETQTVDDAADHPNGPEPDELLVLGEIDELPETETVENTVLLEQLPDGWTVQNPDWEPEAEESGDEEVDLGTMTKAEIQEWADANGYEGVVNQNTMTKDEMIEAITS
jgi:hypothetical protein